MRKLLTLCIVHKGNKVLLGMKKRGFGALLYNGFGGKVQEGESIAEAAVRETQEEAGITPTDLLKLGILEFTFVGQDEILVVHIFKATAYTGGVGESEEMTPEWFGIEAIPFSSMWKDDVLWFPFFLKNKKFTGSVLFDEHNEIVTYELNEVTELP
jgi:8-oxo-dGTP diphosphatase / 2-hydroxy-dATP diphosphatase